MAIISAEAVKGTQIKNKMSVKKISHLVNFFHIFPRIRKYSFSLNANFPLRSEYLFKTEWTNPFAHSLSLFV